MRCVEEEDAARGVVGRRDPKIISQTVHWDVIEGQGHIRENDRTGRRGPNAGA
jgi:hypothetical protein